MCGRNVNDNIRVYLLSGRANKLCWKQRIRSLAIVEGKMAAYSSKQARISWGADAVPIYIQCEAPSWRPILVLPGPGHCSLQANPLQHRTQRGLEAMPPWAGTSPCPVLSQECCGEQAQHGSPTLLVTPAWLGRRLRNVISWHLPRFPLKLKLNRWVKSYQAQTVG